MKTRIFILSLTFLVFCQSLNAQTLFSGGIYTNTTWTSENSPYIITDDVAIFKGVTLTISEGVVVKFEKGKSLKVSGSLKVIGTKEQPVIITSLNEVSDQYDQDWWVGFIFGMNTIGEFQYCEISNSWLTLDLYNAHYGEFNLINSRFHHNFDVVKKYPSNIDEMIVDSCIFENNTYVSSYQWNGTIIKNSVFRFNQNGLTQMYQVKILNNLFHDNINYAMNLVGGIIEYNTFVRNGLALRNWLGEKHSFQFNIVRDNEIGIGMNGAARNYLIANNIICNNRKYNIKNYNSDNFDVSNNCFCLTDSASIRKTIYDGYNDISKGLINFMPFYEDCSVIDTLDLQGITNISEYPTIELFDIYPNPSFGNININLKSIGSKNVSIFITDIYGIKVYEINSVFPDVSTNKISFDFENLFTGTYFLTIKTDNTYETKKFVIIK